ncbi:hypothetical protein L249_6401 [Ophiocordyceps polyrhachis-furcata BCC 54312]|uniref:Uncharacterized protein n=1 Tax=Ophiocordyceps polyrhachis-furcata BCC 54312 TaxID=1330021 RepID=A0A367LL49_9HYPO|nr:hypothetical protein L249_6401 [Ophiocordyceps polyrhachis-furcata BCC 54312]
MGSSRLPEIDEWNVGFDILVTEWQDYQPEVLGQRQYAPARSRARVDFTVFGMNLSLPTAYIWIPVSLKLKLIGSVAAPRDQTPGGQETLKALRNSLLAELDSA